MSHSFEYGPPIPKKPTCHCGKVCFDKRGAQTKANSLMRHGKARRLSVYKCRFGNWYHLTKREEYFFRQPDHDWKRRK